MSPSCTPPPSSLWTVRLSSPRFRRSPAGWLLPPRTTRLWGGLGSLVANLLVDNQVPAKMKKIALPDQYLAAGTLETLQDLYGVSTKAVTEQLRSFLK